MFNEATMTQIGIYKNAIEGLELIGMHRHAKLLRAELATLVQGIVGTE